MGFSLLPQKLLEEVDAQSKARDERLAGAADMLERYPGAWWSGAPGPEASFDSENAGFEYISYAMSQMVWANPRWRVSTRRPRAQQMVAEAMNYGMNRWTVDCDLKTVLEDLVVDYCYCWGVAHVSPQPRVEAYEAEDPPMWPQMSRISPWDFGFDNRAPTWRRARMLWHRYRIDREDLLRVAREDRKKPREKRDGWDIAAIESMSATGQYKESNHGRLHQHRLDGPERDELELIDIFLPGVRLSGHPGPEDGFNGTICTLGVTSSDGAGASHVKPPTPFYGPRWGPYTVFGNYIVPDSPYPLSLLLAAAGNIEQSSRLAQAVDLQVQAYKRLLLAAAGAPHLAKLIKDGKNDHVYSTDGVANLEALIRQYEIGGTTPGNVAAEQRSINKRNRILGMDEVQRGNVTGEGTATEVQLAVEAALGRQGFVKGRFQDGARRAGKTVAWYLFHDSRIVFPLGVEAVEALGLPPDDEAWFLGGDEADGSGVTFDDLGLEIEPYSMERPSEAFLRQRGELISNVLTLVPALAQAAQIGADVKGLLDAYGDAYGMPTLSRLFPNIDSVDLSMIQPEEAEPRLSRDVGVHGLLNAFQPKGAPLAGAGRPQRGPVPQDFAAVG